VRGVLAEPLTGLNSDDAGRLPALALELSRRDVNYSKTILWRRLDIPGHEIATIRDQSDGWLVLGVALFVETGSPCRMVYEIRCDAQWTTRECRLRGAIGARSVHLDIERDVGGAWSVDGADVAEIRGCADIDLGFSPVTNLLPIRRLALPIGARAGVSAAWVRFPELTLELLEQTYTHAASDRYTYESAGGQFRRELTVDAFGCVVDYPGIWHTEATTGSGAPVV
jgi:hypothetical protein